MMLIRVNIYAIHSKHFHQQIVIRALVSKNFMGVIRSHLNKLNNLNNKKNVKFISGAFKNIFKTIYFHSFNIYRREPESLKFSQRLSNL